MYPHQCSRLVSDGEGRRDAGSRVCRAHSAAVAAECQQLRACRMPGDRCDLVRQALRGYDNTCLNEGKGVGKGQG